MIGIQFKIPKETDMSHDHEVENRVCGRLLILCSKNDFEEKSKMRFFGFNWNMSKERSGKLKKKALRDTTESLNLSVGKQMYTYLRASASSAIS